MCWFGIYGVGILFRVHTVIGGNFKNLQRSGNARNHTHQ